MNETTTYNKDTFESSAKFLKGKSIEQEFSDILIREGYIVEDATREEDMLLHVDIWATTKENKRFGIDVKGIKFGNEDRIIVELKNPVGNIGWLFGKQSFVAFESEDYFILVQRDKLCVLTAKLLIDENFLVESFDRMPLYKKLNFKQNKSELVKLKLIDVLTIATKIFRKNKFD
jgi:hypothetical protein